MTATITLTKTAAPTVSLRKPVSLRKGGIDATGGTTAWRNLLRDERARMDRYHSWATRTISYRKVA